MKLAFFEFFKDAGLNADDFIYFNYLVDRLECNKFINWNRSLTAQIVSQYDEGLCAL